MVTRPVWFPQNEWMTKSLCVLLMRAVCYYTKWSDVLFSTNCVEKHTDLHWRYSRHIYRPNWTIIETWGWFGNVLETTRNFKLMSGLIWNNFMLTHSLTTCIFSLIYTVYDFLVKKKYFDISLKYILRITCFFEQVTWFQ